jgi:hypothetical protein
MIVGDDRIAEQNTEHWGLFSLGVERSGDGDLWSAVHAQPVETDEGAVDAGNLATIIVEPVFPAGTAPKSTELKVQVEVGLEGAINGVGNPYDAPK